MLKHLGQTTVKTKVTRTLLHVLAGRSLVLPRGMAAALQAALAAHTQQQQQPRTVATSGGQASLLKLLPLAGRVELVLLRTCATRGHGHDAGPVDEATPRGGGAHVRMLWGRCSLLVSTPAAALLCALAQLQQHDEFRRSVPLVSACEKLAHAAAPALPQPEGSAVCNAFRRCVAGKR